MAFLNNKYTAFDPQMTMVSGVVDDDENCVVNCGTFDVIGQTAFNLSETDKTSAEIMQAMSDGKMIWFKYQL